MSDRIPRTGPPEPLPASPTAPTCPMCKALLVEGEPGTRRCPNGHTDRRVVRFDE